MAYDDFSANDFKAVRAAISTGLKTNQLPDEVIGLDVYAGEAKRFVQFNLDATQIAAEPESVATIAVFYAASILAPTISQVVREKVAGGAEIEWKAYDGEKRAAALRHSADNLIELVKRNHPVAAAPRSVPAFIGVVKARRRQF